MIDLDSPKRRVLERELGMIRVAIIIHVLVSSFWIMGVIFAFLWGVFNLVFVCQQNPQITGCFFVVLSCIGFFLYIRFSAWLVEKFRETTKKLDYILPEEKEKWRKIL